MDTAAQSVAAPSCTDAPQPPGAKAPAAAAGARLADVAAVAVMLLLAMGAAALVCGVYNAFDDGWFRMSGATLAHILALAGF